jgi:hypothetical protein
MSNINVIPFTELTERTQDLSRNGADTRSRTRGIVNDVYTLEIPKVYDWQWMKASSSISCIAEYNSGVVNVNTQDTVCTFSGATITSAMSNRKIKFSNNNNVYDFTYTDGTGGTINPPLSLATNVSNGSYTIFKNIFSLPSNFDHFPVNGGLLFYQSGVPTPLPELLDDDYYEQANASPSATPDSCRPLEPDVDGNLQVEIIPPPSQAYILYNEYFKKLSPMKEDTSGTISFTSNSTSVTGTSTRFTYMTTGDYIRADGFGVNADSVWYRIKTITHNSAMTISQVFRTDSSYTGTYTISKAPEMPYQFHNAIIWGAIEKLLPDQSDPMLLMAHMQYAKVMSDNKIQVQSRHAKDNIELIAEDIEYRR